VTLWIDNQIAPALADWCRVTFQIDAVPVRNLGLARAADRLIFMAAREASAIVITKDADFVRLLKQFGAPPQDAVRMGDGPSRSVPASPGPAMQEPAALSAGTNGAGLLNGAGLDDATTTMPSSSSASER
jgi:predicted nuclease of predicted toxin-antitoxin system